jgi:hypothetical protein
MLAGGAARNSSILSPLLSRLAEGIARDVIRVLLFGLQRLGDLLFAVIAIGEEST